MLQTHHIQKYLFIFFTEAEFEHKMYNTLHKHRYIIIIVTVVTHIKVLHSCWPNAEGMYGQWLEVS